MNPAGALCVVLLVISLFFVEGQRQCPTAPLHPQDRRKDTSTLTIAAYNAEWLFLNRSNCPGTGCPWRNTAEAEHHLQVVAQELTVLDADIVSFEEVQDCYVLSKLNALVPELDYLPYLVTGTDTSTGQNVGILTRVDPSVSLQRSSLRVNYPIAGSQCGYTGGPGDSAVSKHYFTTFNISGLPSPLSLFGMHFLAYPDDVSRCVQREAQASVIKSLVSSALLQGHSTVVLGDLNDFDGLVLDQANSRPISQVLNLLRDPLPTIPGDELVNAASLTEQSNRYTIWWDQNDNCNVEPNELTSLDHILFSKDLAPYVDGVNFAHNYPAVCDTYESDHWPVVLHLTIPQI